MVTTPDSGHERRFDVAVIGLGLIGSAAARHLAATERTVVGIGPGEPTDRSNSSGPFASHYDSGRVTRRIDARREWAILATRSIANYPLLEETLGRSFHRPSGLVFVRNDDEGIRNQREVASDLDISIEVSLTDDIDSRWPDLRFPPGWTAIIEEGPAGHIDPRAMLEAQLIAARNDGAQIDRLAATAIDRDAHGFMIQLADGSRRLAENVLVATGPYPSSSLFEPLAISVRPEAVILAEVADQELERLIDLPSIIYLLDHERLDDVYIVPPRHYPDGRRLIKMGGSHRDAARFVTDEAKRQWMAGRDADELLPTMREVLQSILHRTHFLGFEMKPCLIADTSTGLPFVDRVSDGVYVALGGNGHAAKSSDAIGELAATLVVNDGTWTDLQLDQASFAAVAGDVDRSGNSRHGN